MTISPDVPPVAVDDVVEAAEALRESGLRLSTPRRLILEALFAADGPVAASDLARELSIDESSVYRNLEVLEHHGLVRHVHLGHSAGLYTLVSENEVEYLYCERCARVTTVSPSRLDPVRKRIKAEFGFTARFGHFPIVGVCEECTAER
ncbi:MAG TPA: transcriptional repressor [Solirubrobacteraceae bacterium]|nr:transcriptional repressor [Solirubrobacteraceae bacterium]